MELMIKQSLIAKSKLATIKRSEGVTHFTCVECSAEYDDKEKLELHLFSHYHTYRFICGVCGTGLKRKEHLDRHMQEHTEYRPHICPDCGKGFKRKEHLNIHMTIHKGDKNLMCSLCQKAFYRKDHLQKHLQTHNKNFVKQTSILEPDIDIKQETEEYEEFNPIITNVIGNDEAQAFMETDDQNSSESTSDQKDIKPEPVVDASRPFVCQDCGKSYKRKDHLKIHSWTHIKREVLCGQCGRAFHTADQMLVHVNLVHIRTHETTGGVAQLRALLGDQIDVEVLNNSSSLLVEREASSPERRPHECPVCHRKFKRKQHLKVHANVHFKQTHTVWCSLCNEGFSDNTQFEGHHCQFTNQSQGEGAEYEDTRDSPPQDAKKENHPIDFVEVELNDPSSESRLPLPRRVYVCKYCGKPFKRKDHYKIHLHIHTGVKSFFCPDCGKGFYRKDHLQKHMIVHAKFKLKPKNKKEVPDLVPIDTLKKEVKPEITIHAPSNTKLRMPLQIKVPYQMVMSLDNGEQTAVTIDPTDDTHIVI
ncbi:gastrula zinc finger protein XlCGF57.1-like [Danaus plexippus]|uniref:Uncharacterized protein n=1 Tax=Danaus plexippus plexippus TaxID=278856 RepID=A0A212EPG5_DANPL|nr:gastrula zinc finger protein XlCGF57.1-like [Danaus plexippus]OWR43390.1 hypothetical protein KGM_200326 [Danaus plexippus plexippus]